MEISFQEYVDEKNQIREEIAKTKNPLRLRALTDKLVKLDQCVTTAPTEPTTATVTRTRTRTQYITEKPL